MERYVSRPVRSRAMSSVQGMGTPSRTGGDIGGRTVGRGFGRVLLCTTRTICYLRYRGTQCTEERFDECERVLVASVWVHNL